MTIKSPKSPETISHRIKVREEESSITVERSIAMLEEI